MTTELTVDVDAYVRTIAIDRHKSRNALTLPEVPRLTTLL